MCYHKENKRAKEYANQLYYTDYSCPLSDNTFPSLEKK